MPADYENPDKAEKLLGECSCPIQAAPTRRRLIMTAGVFDERLSSFLDYDLWLGLVTEAPLIRISELRAFCHDRGRAQLTASKLRISFESPPLHHQRAQDQPCI